MISSVMTREWSQAKVCPIMRSKWQRRLNSSIEVVAMPMNRIQFQPGLSMREFTDAGDASAIRAALLRRANDPRALVREHVQWVLEQGDD
jgi:hypothetical protein